MPAFPLRLLAAFPGSLAFCLAVAPAPRARAAATTIAPTPFAGRITEVVFGPSGRPDGVLLNDHTLLEFPASSLAHPAELAPGDQVSGTGLEVLSAPNRVFDRIALSKGARRLFDNSRMQYPPAPPLPARGIPPLGAMSETSTLLAAGATPDGQIDRLILSNASGINVSYVQVPEGAYVNPRSLSLGLPVAIQGAGTRLANGDHFIHAFTAQTVGGPWLLQARGYDGEQWMLKEGSIRQALVTPHGAVDGVLLTDNTSIFFTPVPGGQVPELLPGVRVRAAGPGVGNRMSVDSILLSGQNRFLSLAGSAGAGGVGTAGGRAAQMAGRVPPLELTPMKDSARVEAVFRNDRHELDTIVLADRTRVWIPPELRKSLPRGLVPGSKIAVFGRGGTYAMGVSIQADRISVARTG